MSRSSPSSASSRARPASPPSARSCSTVLGRIADVRRQGQTLRAEGRVHDGWRGGAPRRRGAESDAAAVARGRTQGTCRRSHAADPRHLAQHASSAEGKLQVELAQLEYNLPRMRGLWHHLERLGGGVGTRARAKASWRRTAGSRCNRVSLVKRRLRGLSGQRATRRKERERTSAPTIALAGYTNVGKSTLLNALTGAEASVDDRLFETLDPTTRSFDHDGKRYLVTDTVGFIRRLPTQLVEGFAATLEETLVADLVLHVADASLSGGPVARDDRRRPRRPHGDRGRRRPGRARPEQG